MIVMPIAFMPLIMWLEVVVSMFLIRPTNYKLSSLMSVICTIVLIVGFIMPIFCMTLG